MMNVQDQGSLVEAYLNDRGATLWGRSYDTSDPEGMAAAVAFIIEMWNDLDSRYFESWERVDDDCF